MGDSGNGFYLLLLIDLSNNSESLALAQGVLAALQSRFGDEQVKIDVSMSNAARVVRLFGTMNRKGHSIPDRPHRRSAVLEWPDTPTPVSIEQLRDVAALAPTTEGPKSSANGDHHAGNGHSRLLVERWLADRGVAFKQGDNTGHGAAVFYLDPCPFHNDHGGTSTAIGQDRDGKLWFKCQHDRCSAYKWAALKSKIGEPDAEHYDPPKKSRNRTANNCNAAIRAANVVVIDKQNIPLAATLAQLSDQLLQRGHYYNRAGKLVSIIDDNIHAVCTAPELAGQLSAIAEVIQVRHRKDDDIKDQIPLPVEYGNTWLNNPIECARLPEIKLFTRNPTYDVQFQLARAGFNAPSGIFYAGSEIKPAESTELLDELLVDFCWRSPADRTNYVGLLLTALMILRFLGIHPAAIFNGNQPGLGKTWLMLIVSILRDGRPAETLTYNPDQNEFEKALATKIRGGATSVIIDNAKTSNKSPLIDSPVLERCITDQTISFRLLGQNASIAVENSIIFGITINFGRFSPDLVSRSIAINLHYEGNPKRRHFRENALIEWTTNHRAELLAELCGYVERWKAAGKPLAQNLSSRFPKWATTIGGILDVNHEPDFLDNADASAAEFDPAHSDMLELAEILETNVSLTSADILEHAEKYKLLRKQIGSGSKKSRLTKLGNTLTRFINEEFVVGPDDNKHAVKLLKEPGPRKKVALYSFLPTTEESP